MEDFKALLGEDLFVKVQEKLGEKTVLLLDKGQKGVVDDGQMIPKHRFDEVNTTKGSLERQVKEMDDLLKRLKKDVEGNDTLKAKIEEAQQTIKDTKAAAVAEVDKSKRVFLLKEALMNEGVIDATARDVLATQFDLAKVEVGEDGKIKNFADMVKPFKENMTLKTLFGTVMVQGRQHRDGTSPDPDLADFQGKNPWKAGSVNITQQIELMRTKPELARRLQAAAAQG